jgi:hypothetical protein
MMQGAHIRGVKTLLVLFPITAVIKQQQGEKKISEFLE